MSELQNFTQALFGAANTASSVVNDYTTNRAKLSTQSKQIKLQADINNELMKIQQSSDYTNWQQNMTDFFERVKGSMSDKNSQYYCENNLQAEMFESILSENQVGVSQKVNQMVYGRQRDSALVDYANNLELYAQQYTGQDYITKANEGAKLLYDCGYINEEQLQKQYDTNFQRAYIDVNSKLYQNSVADAVKNNMSEDQFIADIKSKTTELMAIDTKGLPKNFDKEAMDETLEKQGRSNYRAYVQDLQNRNESQLSEIYANMLTNNTASGRNAVRKQGQLVLAQMTGMQLDSSVRARYAGYFALEDYLDGGTTTRGQAVSALSKLDAKDQMNFFIGQWKKGSKGEEGGIAGLYNAYNLFKDSMLKQAQVIQPGATWTDIEEACPIVMQFFDTAKEQFKNIPGMSDVIDNAKNMLEVIGVNETNLGSAMDITYDMLFEVDVSDMDAPTVEKYVKRVATAYNSLYGNALEKEKDYEWLKKESGMQAITNFKLGVTGNEKNLAQALQARANNPDLVYKDKTQQLKETYGSDIKEALTNIEAEEKNEIARYIKATTGRDIDIGTISSDWEEDGAYDVTANKVYTVGTQQYRLRSPDGKTIIMETKKAGENANSWKQTQSTKAVESANSLAATKGKRQIEQESNNAIMASKSMPKAMQAAGKFTDDDTRYNWIDTNNIEDRQYMLRTTANKISSDAGKVYTGKGKRKKDSITEAEFKQKYGISYNEWMATSDPITRWNLILNSK